MTKEQRLLLEDKLTIWRQQSHEGAMDLRDYNRRAVEALEELWADAEEFKERLHDLVMIEAEQDAIGGGPGFKERKEKAWRLARELFEP